MHRVSLAVTLIAAASLAVLEAQPAQTRVARPSDLPNPYRLDPDWPTLPPTMRGPGGRKWGEVIRVHVATGGNIWVFHRGFHDKPSGDATCLNRGDANPPLLEFTPGGSLVRSVGMPIRPRPVMSPRKTHTL